MRVGGGNDTLLLGKKNFNFLLLFPGKKSLGANFYLVFKFIQFFLKIE